MTLFQPGAYEVERAVFSGKFRTHLENRDGVTVADQRVLTDRLIAHFGVEPVTVKRRNGHVGYGSHAKVESRTIVYGPTASTAVVCHEVAHILTGNKNKKEVDYWHGPEWQANYVACVRVALGDWHASRLETGFAKFEADKARNLARAAVKRGARRTGQKAGPRKRVVPVVHGAIRSKAMGKGVYLTWGSSEERLIAVRYGSRAGWYWVVSGYEKDDMDFSASAEVWMMLAKGEGFILDGRRITPLFTERQFSTKTDALEWAVARCNKL